MGKLSHLAERILSLDVGKTTVADKLPGDIINRIARKQHPDRRYSQERVGSQFIVRRTA